MKLSELGSRRVLEPVSEAVAMGQARSELSSRAGVGHQQLPGTRERGDHQAQTSPHSTGETTADPPPDNTVLLVEDDPDVRAVLSLLLHEEGYLAVAVSNGQEALQYLQQGRTPVLILLDLLMPVTNGWEFGEQLRQDPLLSQIPVVVLSGIADGAQKAIRLDAAGVLAKPVRLSALREALARHARRPSDRTARLVGSETPGEGAAPGGAAVVENDPAAAGTALAPCPGRPNLPPRWIAQQARSAYNAGATPPGLPGTARR